MSAMMRVRYASLILTQPRYLCECLFRGFANDVQSMLEVNEFIATLAVVRGINPTQLMSFVFRVYDSRGEGELSKDQLYKQLRLAYGESGLE